MSLELFYLISVWGFLLSWQGFYILSQIKLIPKFRDVSGSDELRDVLDEREKDRLLQWVRQAASYNGEREPRVFFTALKLPNPCTGKDTEDGEIGYICGFIGRERGIRFCDGVQRLSFALPPSPQSFEREGKQDGDKWRCDDKDIHAPIKSPSTGGGKDGTF